MNGSGSTIDSLYAQVEQIDDWFTVRPAAPDSAEYWHEAVELKTRQRDLWQQIAERALGMDVPQWTRRAAFLAWDNCADKISRYQQFEQQCAAGQDVARPAQ